MRQPNSRHSPCATTAPKKLGCTFCFIHYKARGTLFRDDNCEVIGSQRQQSHVNHAPFLCMFWIGFDCDESVERIATTETRQTWSSRATTMSLVFSNAILLFSGFLHSLPYLAVLQYLQVTVPCFFDSTTLYLRPPTRSFDWYRSCTWREEVFD